MLPRESSVTTRVQSVPTPPPAPVSSLSHKEDQFIFQKSTEIAEVLTKTTSGKPTHKWAKPSKSSVKTSKGSHGPGTREAAGGQGMDTAVHPLPHGRAHRPWLPSHVPVSRRGWPHHRRCRIIPPRWSCLLSILDIRPGATS